MNGIQVNNLTKNYRDVAALKGVSLGFEEGKMHGLLGRNGAGKTTLLNIITGRIFATAGDVQVDGEQAVENDTAQGKVFMMSEKMLYPPKMRVREVFRWTAQFYPSFNNVYAMELAHQFGLRENQKMDTLSTGYATIFKLVVGLASGTPYLILDEPVLGLDAGHRDLFYKTLLHQCAESPRCVIISTHLVEEVSGLVEDVIILKNGEVIVNESRDTLLAKGYTVAGAATKVDEYIGDKKVLGQDGIGGLKTAYIMGQRPQSLPEGLEVTNMDLQRLFIEMTN